MLVPLALLPEEVATLDACSQHARHPRQRRRAQAVLGHHRGQSVNQLAAFFAVRYATVHGWLTAWRDHGLAGLGGRPPGRPSPQAAPGGPKKVTAWLGPATQQLRRWIPRLRRAFGVKRHISTLRRMARAAGYAWKRCRRSLRGQRDPAAFAAC